jgi:UDP-N-acetylglucosamine acyltransferase
MVKANIGLGAIIHQRRVIGAYSMIGMNSTVTKNVPPFVIAHGSPCRPTRLNTVGLSRAGFSEEEIGWLDLYQATVTDLDEEVQQPPLPFGQFFMDWREWIEKIG